VRRGTAAADPEAQHGGNTSNPKKVVTMRPVRILLVAIALVAVALAGWAFGRGGGYTEPQTSPAASQAPAPTEPAEPADPGARDTPPAVDGPTDTTQPAPKPRIFGFGSEPVLPEEGGFWRLPSGAGTLTLVTDARYATKVEFWLTPTGTGVADLGVRIGQDTNGRDGYLTNWNYKDEPLLAHLTVRATGPGGTTEQVVGIYHPDPQP
jgi:hypothetical protein